MIKKYNPVYKEEYEQWLQNHQDDIKNVSKDKMRLAYHLMPPIGWLNDPNGLCQFHGIYHIYYQYDPFDINGELKLWGHYTTKDFIHFENQEPFLYPDTDIDTHGAYSGSAFIKNDTIHYFYTGNIKLFSDPTYDYIHSGRVANTIHFTSKDGFDRTKKELILGMEDYPDGFTQHIRDPKIIEENSVYYMVLGARDNQDTGCILIYRSLDLENWQYAYSISTKTPLGYMWECPDLFEVNGQKILICCPQGVETQGCDYANVHSCTWMRIDGSMEDGIHVEDIHMFDRGFDFYAPQSFQDEQGRRILIGWLGIPDADYTNPTTQTGWQHALTLPRELVFENGILHQRPIQELVDLRDAHVHANADNINTLQFDASTYELCMQLDNCKQLSLDLNPEIHITYKDKIFTVDITDCGYGRTTRSAVCESLEDIHIYSDTTSLEIFVNDGIEAFTTRIYPQQKRCICLQSIEGNAEIDIFTLKPIDVE